MPANRINKGIPVKSRNPVKTESEGFEPSLFLVFTGFVMGRGRKIVEKKSPPPTSRYARKTEGDHATPRQAKDDTPPPDGERRGKSTRSRVENLKKTVGVL